MAFMVPDYYFGDMYVVDGCEYTPVPVDAVSRADVADECDVSVNDVEVVGGWWARLDAPGYMDKTDWSGPFNSRPEAKAFIRDHYEVDPITGDELPEYDDAPIERPKRRFHTREAFDAEEETFDGLDGGDDDTWEESFRTPDGTDVHVFVFDQGGSAGYILTVEIPGESKPRVFRGSTPGELYDGVATARRMLVRVLNRQGGGLMGLPSFGRGRR